LPAGPVQENKKSAFRVRGMYINIGLRLLRSKYKKDEK